MITKVKSDYIISLSEVKQHLRVDTEDEDNYILQLIKASVNYAEQYIQKDIAVTANTLVIKSFSGSVIEVDEGNLVSITSVKDEELTSYSESTHYELTKYDSHFEIDFSDSNVYFNDEDITLVFVTGYTLDTLPASIRQAIYIKVADLYDVDRTSYGFNSYERNAAQNAFESLLNYYMAQRVRYIKN